MISAPLHPSESARLQALKNLEILDSVDEAAFDEITLLASTICGTSISLVSLVDLDRQWFKSRVGLDAAETGRDIAFCSHAILQEEVFEIQDASTDIRFSDNPLVTQDPSIRFYAGAPLVTASGYPIGTLCVIDQGPKKLNDDQTLALKTLAKQVISQMELRLQNRQLARMQKEQEQVMTMLAHDLRSPFNGILSLSRILHDKADTVTPERLQALSSSILESSIKVYQLLDELLQWSRNNMNAVSVNLVPTSVEQVALDTLEFMHDALSYKQINVTHQLEPKLSVLADQALIKTVIRNLLANAIKYSPERSCITVRSAKINDQVEITITDEGVGVAKDSIPKLFHSHIHSEEGEAGEIGFGIGLHICQAFIEKQKGQIWLDETHQPGARFVISLPFSEGH